MFFWGGGIKQFEEYFLALGEITYIIDFLFSSPRLGHLRPFPPCPSPQFTSHTLAPHCPIALKEGRFKEANSVNSQNLSIYADLPGMIFNGRTIPVDIVATSVRPDIVIVNRTEKFIELMELTYSFEKNIDSANLRKSTNYLDMKTDIEEAG